MKKILIVFKKSKGIQISLISGSLFIWGVITGRCLPQWQDVGNGKIMYVLMFTIGFVALYFFVVKPKWGYWK